MSIWANIRAKRERIKRGSGERMRKPGSSGAPTAADFRAASEDNEKNTTVKIELDEAMNPAMRRARLIKRVLSPIHNREKLFKTKDTSEPQSTKSDDSGLRLDTTDSTVRIYKRDTPGQ